MNPHDKEAEVVPARTPLYDLHIELGAKMVPFAGYEMPVQYPRGIIREHLHTRSAVGLFDVSHMGQVRLHGARAAQGMETLVPVDVVDLAPGHQRYAMFTTDSGGIYDDLMVVNAGDYLFVVVNAACKEADIARMRESLGDYCEIEVLAERGLLALQGPAAATALAPLAPRAGELRFMQAAAMPVAGIDCFVTRSGYTGEDGFEISVPVEATEDLARRLLAQDGVEAIGLGARDSLRLEAGLCLYGHDIDTETTPVEANLRWALSKARRADGARPGGYPGAEVIIGQLATGVERRLVGIHPEGRAPVRDGTELVGPDGAGVGRVTSGGYGPSIGGPVAMGYVATAKATAGTELSAMVRGRPLPVRVTRLPFIAHNYCRG